MRTSSAANSDRGFSFVEVLVALVILAVLVQVLAVTLLNVQRSEDRARNLRATRLQGQALAAAEFSGSRFSSPWAVDSEELEEGGHAWKQVNLRSPDDRAANLEVYLLRELR